MAENETTRDDGLTPHRINIEHAVEELVDRMLADPDGRDVETERDDLLAVIYGWQQEIATDGRRAGLAAPDHRADNELRAAFAPLFAPNAVEVEFYARTLEAGGYSLAADVMRAARALLDDTR
jgi:hypothetical protein